MDALRQKDGLEIARIIFPEEKDTTQTFSDDATVQKRSCDSAKPAGELQVCVRYVSGKRPLHATGQRHHIYPDDIGDIENGHRIQEGATVVLIRNDNPIPEHEQQDRKQGKEVSSLNAVYNRFGIECESKVHGQDDEKCADGENADEHCLLHRRYIYIRFGGPWNRKQKHEQEG